MKIEPTIVELQETLLVGCYQTMTLSDDHTFELWKAFAPRIKEIKNRTNRDRFSLKIFPFSEGLSGLTPNTPFIKWAAVPVNSFSEIPHDMKTLIIPKGLYAAFVFKGTMADFGNTLQNIFTKWLPASDFLLDDRPHFEIMGETYQLNNPDSEETIWIPLKPKKVTD